MKVKIFNSNILNHFHNYQSSFLYFVRIVYEAPACDRFGEQIKAGKKSGRKRAGSIVDLRIVAGDTCSNVYSCISELWHSYPHPSNNSYSYMPETSFALCNRYSK